MSSLTKLCIIIFVLFRILWKLKLKLEIFKEFEQGKSFFLFKYVGINSFIISFNVEIKIKKKLTKRKLTGIKLLFNKRIIINCEITRVCKA